MAIVRHYGFERSGMCNHERYAVFWDHTTIYNLSVTCAQCKSVRKHCLLLKRFTWHGLKPSFHFLMYAFSVNPIKYNGDMILQGDYVIAFYNFFAQCGPRALRPAQLTRQWRDLLLVLLASCAVPGTEVEARVSPAI